MPQSIIYLFRELSGEVPVELYLGNLQSRVPKAFAKCVDAILELERLGSEARRPLADLLRDGIYELRIRHLRVNYRLLYFFHGRNVVVVSHGLTKKDKVPAGDIEQARERKTLVESSPKVHTASWGDE